MAVQSRVLIVVFDGLQPAQITPELMPNLSAFAQGGVTFANHHPVFPTVTRVNASSLVTGCTPGRHGLAGNTFLCRDFDPHRVIPALEPTLQEIADSTGRALLLPTLADVLGQHGMEYFAIGTGTSGNAYVHNPNAATAGGATIHPDFALPRPLHGELTKRFGEWPAQDLPNTARLTHARRILTEFVLPERDPVVALLWSSEPDKTQHEDGVGLGRASQALTEADAEFGELMDWLRANGRDEATDVFVASDHGYSTISDVVRVEQLLREADFPTIDHPGGVAVAANGGSALLYVNDGDPKAAERLTAWLVVQPWCGPLFRIRTRWMPGWNLALGPPRMRRAALTGPDHVVPVAKRRQYGRLPRVRSRHGRRHRSGSAWQPQPSRTAQHRTGRRAIVQAGNHRRDADRQHRPGPHHSASAGIGRGRIGHGREGVGGGPRERCAGTNAGPTDPQSRAARVRSGIAGQRDGEDAVRRLGQPGCN